MKDTPNDYKPLPLKNFIYEVTNLRTGEKTVDIFEAHTREYLERNVLDIENYSFKFLREEPKYALNSTNKDKVIKVLNSIMDNFDFAKVRKVMKALKWKWAGVKGDEDGVPTEQEIGDFAAKLLWDLVNDPKNKAIGQGGFFAEKDFLDPDDPWIQLSFHVEDWSDSPSEMGLVDDDPDEVLSKMFK